MQCKTMRAVRTPTIFKRANNHCHASSRLPSCQTISWWLILPRQPATVFRRLYTGPPAVSAGRYTPPVSGAPCLKTITTHRCGSLYQSGHPCRCPLLAAWAGVPNGCPAGQEDPARAHAGMQGIEAGTHVRARVCLCLCVCVYVFACLCVWRGQVLRRLAHRLEGNKDEARHEARAPKLKPPNVVWGLWTEALLALSFERSLRATCS